MWATNFYNNFFEKYFLEMKGWLSRVLSSNCKIVKLLVAVEKVQTIFIIPLIIKVKRIGLLCFAHVLPIVLHYVLVHLLRSTRFTRFNYFLVLFHAFFLTRFASFVLVHSLHSLRSLHPPFRLHSVINWFWTFRESVKGSRRIPLCSSSKLTFELFKIMKVLDEKVLRSFVDLSVSFRWKKNL